MDEQPGSSDRAGRRAKRFLSPSQKYEIWLQLVRGRGDDGAGGGRRRVDRSTVLRIRQVAKVGALAALAEYRPGLRAGGQNAELDAAKAEIARLSETVKEMAVKLMLVDGKGGWG
jgi:transposase